MITISAFADEIGPDLKLQMDTCETHGIKHIDVRGIDNTNVSTMDLKKVQEYKKQMDDRGFAVACVGSPLGKISMDDDFGQHLEVLKHCAQIAHVFATPFIRIFSFYASKGKNILDQRQAVMDRMWAMTKVAELQDVVLLHENEANIYGAKPDGVKDLFATIKSKNFKGIYDPANFVVEGIAPYDDGWTKGLAELTDYFHIKDKKPAEHTCIPAGQGVGQIAQVFADLKKKNWSGIMTLEPHMSAAGQFAGFTGPDLFAQAVAGLKKMLDQAHLAYKKP